MNEGGNGGPWSIQARTLKDAVGGWRSKQWENKSLDYLVALADQSATWLDAYATAIQQVLAGEEDIAVFACGSNGRLEAWDASDIDLLMIVRDRPRDATTVRRYCELLKRVCAKLSEGNANTFDLEKITKMHQVLTDDYLENIDTDVFRRWVPLSFLTDNQFDESDSLVRRIRRVSLILESQPLTMRLRVHACNIFDSKSMACDKQKHILAAIGSFSVHLQALKEN